MVTRFRDFGSRQAFGSECRSRPIAGHLEASFSYFLGFSLVRPPKAQPRIVDILLPWALGCPGANRHEYKKSTLTSGTRRSMFDLPF
jgi:hypothetical protein